MSVWVCVHVCSCARVRGGACMTDTRCTCAFRCVCVVCTLRSSMFLAQRVTHSRLVHLPTTSVFPCPLVCTCRVQRIVSLTTLLINTARICMPFCSTCHHLASNALWMLSWIAQAIYCAAGKHDQQGWRCSKLNELLMSVWSCIPLST